MDKCLENGYVCMNIGRNGLKLILKLGYTMSIFAERG